MKADQQGFIQKMSEKASYVMVDKMNPEKAAQAIHAVAKGGNAGDEWAAGLRAL